MTIVDATQMYYYAICPSRDCKAELVVEFDNAENPTIVIVKCSKCGYIVSVLGGLEDSHQPQVPTPISVGNTKEELVSS